MDWERFQIPAKYAALDALVMADCAATFSEIEDIRDFNQLKVLSAFIECRVGSQHMQGSTGYGYGDVGRDMLDRVFARAVGAEDSLCRTHFMSGTHAITVALFGLLRKEMTMLSVTGEPYETLKSALGLRGPGFGSLDEYGIRYNQIELHEGSPDLSAIAEKATEVELIYIQRSRGYGARRAMTLEDIGEITASAKSANKDVIVVVDNCYGEFTEKDEPLSCGADIIIGSLIKNPGGGVAETGGYIAGRKDLVELIANRLSAPGVGRGIGSNPAGHRNAYLGLYMAPQVTAEALKSAVYVSRLFERLGYETDPKYDARRSDVITSVSLGNERALSLFCRALQSSSPVDSYATPEASEMPGYDGKVIMAAGAFTAGSSIELSADAPAEAPYLVYVQGGLNLIASRLAFLRAASLLEKEGF